MDWAGTAVDYGCFAPVAAFIESFKAMGVSVDIKDVRDNMGLTKIEEIRALYQTETTGKEFMSRFGRKPEEKDVAECYAKFQEILYSTLAEYSKPIPGVAETISSLRRSGIKVGSTTGYTGKMMDIVIPAAAKNGYVIDHCVTSDNLPGGRPAPYMIYKNMCDMAVPSRFSVIKYGDTIADIREGVNAGVWSVGVITGSNEMGLTEEETMALPEAELKNKMLGIRNKMYAAGAHYVVDSIAELPGLIESINLRMSQE